MSGLATGLESDEAEFSRNPESAKRPARGPTHKIEIRIPTEARDPANTDESGAFDLTRPLPDRQVKEIRAALLKWKAVFFRDQHLDHAQHVAFSRQFGELTPAHAVYGGSDGDFPEIYTVDRDRKNKRYAGEYMFYPWTGWHNRRNPGDQPARGLDPARRRRAAGRR